ncbi:unnamed protein product, partial [Didymodactylos carnosus]
LKELYIIKTLVIGQCYVKSLDLRIEKDNVYPLGLLQIRYDPCDRAHDHRINETHRCYRWKSLTSTSGLGWQWNKPSESNIGAFLFSGTVLLVISIIIPILRRRYQTEFQIRQQQQIEIPLRNQHGSPPTYDEAIEILTPTTTQTRT